MKKWSTPEEKLSHENKTLRQHIQEIKLLLQHFLEFFDLTSYNKLAEFLAEYHDSGKLHKDWELGSKKGHAHHSYEYLLENKIVFENQSLNSILQFFILKHHSTLSNNISENLGKRRIEIMGREVSLETAFETLTKEELEEVISFFYNNDKKELIDLVDVFGLFKLADICSAEGKTSFKLEKPEIKEDIVLKLFSKLDEKRWVEQKRLINLPDISILRAYTGWGKTSASLLFFLNRKPAKIFYLLPTITAINQFYKKLENTIGKDKVSKYFYFLDTEIKDDDERFSQLFFFKNFLTPTVITTVDQFLLSFLQVGKYYTKRVMFRNSGLIIDEIHLLNPLMLKLITDFISFYKKIYNLKVLFMSATVTNSLVKYLKENLELSESSFIDFSKGYEEKRRVMWRYIDEDIENSLEKAINEKNKGKRVLIIVNTVEKAIKVGRKLEEDFGLKYEKDFITFHARFMYQHRKDKEEWIENFREKPHILVATQVCEVSLDISYDLMFTELASLPSLIQRFGRVNRYGDRTKEVNVYIFTPEIKDQKKYPYSEEELENAKEIIKEFEEDKLENEKKLLDAFNEKLTYERLLKEIEEAKEKVKLEYWQDLLKFFFSLDIKDERLRRLLNYREGFTVMVIPDPECISDETKEYVESLLSRSESFANLSFKEREKLFASIKEVAVPIPIWWLRGYPLENKRAFPVVYFKDKIYNKKYGFFDVKELGVII